MIKVIVGSNFTQKSFDVDESTTTIVSVLDEAGIDPWHDVLSLE